MVVQDLWFRDKRGPDGERLKTARHGRGRRWRVTWEDPTTGEAATRSFERKAEAEAFDDKARGDIARGQFADPRAGRITVAEYAETWRKEQLHRRSTASGVELRLRVHVLPILGHLPMAQVRSSAIKRWVLDRSQHMQPSTLRMIFSTVLVPMFNQAVADQIIGVSPCVRIRLPDLPAGDYFIPSAEQVYAVADALGEESPQLRAVPLLVAGTGLRAGEVFGLEAEQVRMLQREVHVRQQILRETGRDPFIAPPKTKTSVRSVEVGDTVRDALARHFEDYPPVLVKIQDEVIDHRKVTTREARLVFATKSGNPLYSATWSYYWSAALQRAKLPANFTLRSLRHFYATVLIYGGANVKTVQLKMGHATPTTTLNTYVNYWPDSVDTTRSLVDAALAPAA